MRNINLSPMDAERFGVVTAKCTVESAADLAGIEDWCDERGVDFVIARVGTDDLRTVQQMEDRGFRLMDTLVYFRRAFDERPLAPPQLPASYRVADDTRPTPEEMAEVARLSFSAYGGHYHADDRLAPEAADQVYVSWAARSAESPQVAQEIVTIRHTAAGGAGTLVAFATLNDADGDSEGVLFAVHPDHQGKGLHRALIQASLLNAHRRGCRGFFSSTQLNNRPVQRNWAREGLIPSHSYYTFHQWRGL
ncbi:GNAT family N-acetyltransferase [Roseateles sp.]|uniref:GNAT family N-acetyltransferase n=1 Tax=Roseateles sp. TaxID=1971397 RepID=UPI002F3EA2A3